MWVQIALKAAAVPADGRDTTIGLPACVATMDPPTGIAESIASAPGGGVVGDGCGGGAAADDRLAPGVVPCGAV
jgi:hypothetical protein